LDQFTDIILLSYQDNSLYQPNKVNKFHYLHMKGN